MQRLAAKLFPENSTTSFMLDGDRYTLTTHAKYLNCPKCKINRRELYLHKKQIRCKKCWKFTKLDILVEKSQKMREKLKENRSYHLVSPHSIVKPRNMRQKTFEKRIKALVSLENHIIREQTRQLTGEIPPPTAG